MKPKIKQNEVLNSVRLVLSVCLLSLMVGYSDCSYGSIVLNTTFTDACIGSNNGTISLTATNGTLPYSFSWSNGSTNQNLTGLVASTYSVTVTDAIGITAITSVAVGTNPNPVAGIVITSGSANLCAGSSVTMVATPANSSAFSWAPNGEITASITKTPVTNTVYSVTVTDINGCTGQATKSITVFNVTPAEPGTISGITSMCFGSSQTYSIAPVANATSYIWTLPGGWTGTSSTTSINVTIGNTSGNVSVRSSNACGNSLARPLAVTVNHVPNMPGALAGPTEICAGSTQTYSIVPVVGATSYTWTLPSGWAGASNSNSISVTSGNANGIISVFASNGCGSGLAKSLLVSVNNVPNTPGVITGNTLICAGSTNTYSITPVLNATTYYWWVPAGFSGTSSSPSITVTASTVSGNISVLAMNDCGVSANIRTLVISVGMPPALPDAIIGSTNVCTGGAQTYAINEVAGATSYIWTLPSGWTGTSNKNSIVVMPAATSGTITVRASNYCGTSYAQSIAVSGFNLTPVTVTSNPASANFCAQIAPTSVTLSASPGYSSYIWSPGGATTQNITVNAANTYVVVATNAGGCTTSATKIVTNNCAAPTSLNTSNIQTTSAKANWIQSQCGYNYSIRISVHNLNSWTTHVISPNNNYTFAGLATSTQYDWQIRTNCNTSGTINSGWTPIQSFTTLAPRMAEEINPVNPFNIYPNPASNQVNIAFSTMQEGSYNLMLMDMTGRTVKSETDNAVTGENNHIMNLDGVSKGVYIVFIQKGEDIFKSKLVVQ